jgi:putative radical SAM enzyme (TIGR03279 family)
VLLQVNGQEITDILDYQYLTADENLQVLVQRYNGEHWLLEIEKDYDESLGLAFQDGGWGTTRQCGNKCIFCFVDQMPGQMRPTLYINDDDYRLSFAQGNFITLTNVGAPDLGRIAQMRLSPLYISVHTTNPALRLKMMGNPRADRIMDQLRFLAQAGIQMHTQVVLCPGINDGPELTRTISDLGELWPAVRSLAVVPVGLTGCRQGLYNLRPYNAPQAQAVVQEVQRWQKIFTTEYQYPQVFASDEFHLLAGAPIPAAQSYGGFPQTENGVGLVRLFMDEWQQLAERLPDRIEQPLHCSLVTGTLAESVLTPVVAELNRIVGLQVDLQVLENNYFGKTVTVAGLLTGQDLLENLAGRDLGHRLFIPGVMLREGDQVFLDDLTLAELSHRLNVQIYPVDSPGELVHLLGLRP